MDNIFRADTGPYTIWNGKINRATAPVTAHFPVPYFHKYWPVPYWSCLKKTYLGRLEELKEELDIYRSNFRDIGSFLIFVLWSPHILCWYKTSQGFIVVQKYCLTSQSYVLGTFCFLILRDNRSPRLLDFLRIFLPVTSSFHKSWKNLKQSAGN